MERKKWGTRLKTVKGRVLFSLLFLLNDIGKGF
jgi:hypothetical protein